MFARRLSDEMLKKCLFWSGDNKLHIEMRMRPREKKEMRMKKYECTLFFNSRISPSRKNSTTIPPRTPTKAAFKMTPPTPPKLLKAAKHTSVFGKQLLSRNKFCVQAKLMT